MDGIVEMPVIRVLAGKTNCSSLVLAAVGWVVAGCLLASCSIQGSIGPSTTESTGRSGTLAPSIPPAPHDDSDPGDRKLRMLAADPVLADLPASLIKTAEHLNSGGSYGAGVSITFTSTASSTEVYRMIGENASRNGWIPEGGTSSGLPIRWVKTYPGGTPATLTLYQEGVPRGTTYMLLGGI